MSPIVGWFLVLALVGPIFAQEGGEPSARSLLERAAYILEHKGDKAEALRILKSATASAERAGDPSLLSEVRGLIAKLEAPPTGEPPAVPPSDIEQGVDELLRRALPELDADAKSLSARTRLLLGLYGGDAVTALAQGLSGQPIPVRIAHHAGFPSAPTFLSPTRAPELLVMIEDPRARTAIREGVASPNSLVRASLAGVIGDHPDDRGLLLGLLDDPVAEIRKRATRGLARLPDPTLASVLLAAYRRDSGSRIESALWTMNEAGVIEMLADPKLAESVAADLLRTAPAFKIKDEQSFVRAIAHRLPYWRSVDSQVLAWKSLNRALSGLRRVPEDSSEALRSRIMEGLASAMHAEEEPGRREYLAVMHLVGGIDLALGGLQDPPFGLPIAFPDQFRTNPVTSKEQVWNAWAHAFRTVDESEFPKILNAVLALSPDRQRLLASLAELGAFIGRSIKEESRAQLLLSKLDTLPRPLRIAWEDQFVANTPPRAEHAQRYLDALMDSGGRNSQAILSALIRSRNVELIPKILDGHANGKLEEEGLRSLLREWTGSRPETAAACLRWLDAGLASECGKLPNSWPRAAMLVCELLGPKGLVDLAAKHWARGDPGHRSFLAQQALSRPGPEACEWSLRVIGDLRPVESLYVLALRQFGTSLFEPGLDEVLTAVSDHRPKVRAVANEEFTAYRKVREAKAEYEAWKKGRADADQTIAELRRLLSDPNPMVLVGAAKAVGVLKARAALPELARLMSHPDASVVKAAQLAIDSMNEPTPAPR